MEIFDDEGHLITVSDGSVVSHGMKFEWVLAKPNGIVLIQGFRTIITSGKSVRSEGTGMLAVTLFALVLTYNKRNTIIHLKSLSKNQDFIYRMNNYNIPHHQNLQNNCRL